MIPGFGFSVGDFIAAAGLIKKVADALKDAGGASGDYQHVIIELEELDRALKVVAALEPNQSNASHVNAIRGMALSCQLPLRQFLNKIQKYEGSLGAMPSNRSFSRNARKAKWAVYIADQVRSLRAVVAAKVVSINLLLNAQISGAISNIEPVIREERNHLMSEIFRVRQSMSELKVESQKTQFNATRATECAEKAANAQAEALASFDTRMSGDVEEIMGSLDSLSSSARSVETSILSLRDIGQQILQFMQSFPLEIRELLHRILRTNLQLYHVLLHVQNNLTKSPTMLLESNIRFEDALGRTKNLPYEWFRHWDTFEGLLKSEFKGIPGESKVLDGSYYLLNDKNKGQVIRKDDWAQTVTPASSISMSMIINQLRLHRGTCPRPSCKRFTASVAIPGLTITCQECGLKYSIIEDSLQEPKIVDIEDEETYVSEMQLEEDTRIFGERPIPLDLEIKEFVLPFGDHALNENNVTGLGPTAQPYLISPVDPMDLDEPEQLDFTYNNLITPSICQGESAMNENLDQANKQTPLDLWLSGVPWTKHSSNTPSLTSIVASEDLESQGIENFKNIHINREESPVYIQAAAPDNAWIDNTNEIAFGARIFYRNIKDRYPQLPEYMARRLAKANESRSDRLGFSRLEQELEQKSSSDDCDEVSLDFGPDRGKLEPGNSTKATYSLGIINGSRKNTNDELQDAPASMSGLIKGTKSLKRKSPEESNPADSSKPENIRKISYWSRKQLKPSPHSSASGSSTMNSSLHGSDPDRGSDAGPRSFSTGKSSRSGPVNDHREPLLTLPPPPIELGSQRAFVCDICGYTVQVLRKRDWKKHVFQDLEPYMCTYEECKIPDKTYATRRAFINHEMRHHREVARKFGCNYCKKKFGRKRDAKKHIHFECSEISSFVRKKYNRLSHGFRTIEERVSDSICPFCTEYITGGTKVLTQHLGRHLEEISFAVVRKPYEEWQFYDESVSAQSPVPSVILNENIFDAVAQGNTKLVMNLLTAGADVNSEKDGQSLLHIASAKGDYSMVWLLLQKGADHQSGFKEVPSSFELSRFGLYDHQIDEMWYPKQSRTALEKASINGHVKVVSLLTKVASDQGLQDIAENALLLTVKQGNLEIIQEIVKNLEEIGDECVAACLESAAKEGFDDIVKFLLLGNDITGSSIQRNFRHSESYNFYDPLLAAFKSGCKGTFLLLLENGIQISKWAWHQCALNGDHEIISAMIEHKTGSDASFAHALIGAARGDRIHVALILLENGVQVTNQAIIEACGAGHLSFLELLLSKEPALEASYLECAIRCGHTDIALLLLKKGIQVSSETITQASSTGSSLLGLLLDKCTALQVSHLECAIKNGHPKIIETIFSRRPDLIHELTDRSIFVALNNGSAQVLELLLQYGHELPLPKDFISSDIPLHDAASKGYCELAQLLISKGFDVNAEGYYRENPLHRACEGGYTRMVEILLNTGAAVNGTNGSKLRTPLAYARAQEVQNLLIGRGAVTYKYSSGKWVASEYKRNKIQLRIKRE